MPDEKLASPLPIPYPDPSTHSSLRFSGKDKEVGNVKMATKLIHGGMHQDEWSTDPLKRSTVNPPVYRASTIVFPTVASMRFANTDWPFTGLFYGRHGNPTTCAVEEAYSALEGADNACVTSSGVAALTASILAFVCAGDHILVTDAVFEPARLFCDSFLQRFGVETTYYTPAITPDAFEALIRPNTKLVLVESPASLSFEIIDIPAIADRAHKHGMKVLCDNTWGPTLFRAFENGCDVTICSATKYLCGHSDIVMGLAGAKDEDTYRAIKKSVMVFGCPPGSDEAFLGLRGIRTLGIRLKQQGISGMKIARWLEERPEVIRMMHPALESHPQHHLYKKLFNGSSGLFGFQLKEGYSQEAVDAMLDGMKLISMGYSWGGFESLLLHTNINATRSVDIWKYGDGYGQTMRIHVGLEDVGDLIKDLEEGFERLNSL